MTVTKRKQKPRETGGSDPIPSGPPTLESGIKASCDSCSADITHSVHVRCAEKHQGSERLTCPDFDLCVDVSPSLSVLSLRRRLIKKERFEWVSVSYMARVWDLIDLHTLIESFLVIRFPFSLSCGEQTKNCYWSKVHKCMDWGIGQIFQNM